MLKSINLHLIFKNSKYYKITERFILTGLSLKINEK